MSHINGDEIHLWFQQIEHRMRILAIKLQEWKAIALAQNHLEDVTFALHDFIVAENSYMDLKERLLKRFAPTKLDECREARFAKSTGLPTETAATIHRKMCDKGNDMT